MAYFAAKEDTLAANVAQTFNFKSQRGGYGAQSLVYKNDSANTHLLTLDNGTKFDSSVDRGQPFQFHGSVRES